jgi:arsenate reductase-like glutaredoxin family protein
METTNEITLIYSSAKDGDNKIKAFVESLPGYVVKLVDVVRESLSEKQLMDLANKMKLHIEDLIDPAFDDHIRVHNEGLTLMHRSDMLSLMAHDPKILHTPVVVVGNKASKFASAYKLFQKKWNNPFGSKTS